MYSKLTIGNKVHKWYLLIKQLGIHFSNENAVEPAILLLLTYFCFESL